MGRAAMRPVMIVGAPGAGKTAFASRLGEITRLPVHHAGRFDWEGGWTERPAAERDRLCRDIEARPAWILEGGASVTWSRRLARADTLIWLDPPAGRRLARVLWRSLVGYGRPRPDLPEGCAVRLDPGFLLRLWRGSRGDRAEAAALFEACQAETARHRLARRAEIKGYLRDLARAVRRGNLGIPHR